jgi:hypothetical protein
MCNLKLNTTVCSTGASPFFSFHPALLFLSSHWKDEVGMACSTHHGYDKYIQNLSRKARDNIRDLGAGERIILNWIFMKLDMRTWSALNSVPTGYAVRLFPLFQKIAKVHHLWILF